MAKSSNTFEAGNLLYFQFVFFSLYWLISTQNHKLQQNNCNRDEIIKKTKWKPENVDEIRKSIDDNYLFIHRAYVCAAPAALTAHKHKHSLLWLIMILLYNRMLHLRWIFKFCQIPNRLILFIVDDKINEKFFSWTLYFQCLYMINKPDACTFSNKYLQMYCWGMLFHTQWIINIITMKATAFKWK